MTSRGFLEPRATFFSKIKKLPAATTLVISRDNLVEKVYWKVEDIKPIRYESYNEYVERLKILVDNAVNVRLRTLTLLLHI